MKTNKMEEKHYYITESKPNGTEDLIITDIDGTVIKSINEAVFWPVTTRKAETLALCDGESVFGTGKDIGDDDDLPEDMKVWKVDYDFMVKFIAVSPTQSEEEVLKQIRAFRSSEGTENE